MKKLLLGTHNPARIQMYRHGLAHLPLKILTLDELGIQVEVVEDGRSTAENAAKKASEYYRLSGITTLSNDGALTIDRFPPEKQPGLYVRRITYENREVTDQDILNYYIHELKGVGGEALGHWVASIALAIAPDKVINETFTFQTKMTSQPKGTIHPGRELDSIMVDVQTGKYYTEMKDEERPYFRALVEFVERHLDAI